VSSSAADDASSKKKGEEDEPADAKYIVYLICNISSPFLLHLRVGFLLTVVHMFNYIYLLTYLLYFLLDSLFM